MPNSAPSSPPAASTFRFTSTWRASGSRPTGMPRWPCRSTSRTRASSASSRRRCWPSKAASTSGACASCATRPATSIDNAYKLRLRRQRRAAVRQSRRSAYPEFYTPQAVQQELRPAPRSVVRAEPSRRGLRRDLRGVADAGVELASALCRLAGDQEAGVHGRADAAAARQAAAGRRRERGRSAARACAQTLRAALRRKRAALRRRSPGVLRSRPAAAVLRRPGARTTVRPPRSSSAAHRRERPPDGRGLDRHLPVHDRPGARGHDRALPRAEAAPRAARGRRRARSSPCC